MGDTYESRGSCGWGEVYEVDTECIIVTSGFAKESIRWVDGKPKKLGEIGI